MTKVKASALRGQSKDELTKQLNEHKQVQYSQTPISDNDWSKAEQIKKNHGRHSDPISRVSHT